MLKKLLSRVGSRKAASFGSVPEGSRVYAIGDIHGRADLLEQLLSQIDSDDSARGPADTHVIFLGDLVDRGPDSARVIDLARSYAGSRPNVRFLMGNHEEVYLKAASGDPKSVRFFYRIGGKETLMSYGMSQHALIEMKTEELAEEMLRILPPEHIRFLQGFEDMIEIGDYVFVHAGVRPGVPLHEQTPSDLRWIREDFLADNEYHGKVVVYGHTISDEVVEKPNRIGIDTGAYYSGKLTALCLEGSERWYLDTATH